MKNPTADTRLSDIAMVVGFLGPCGLNTPHTHPRATEFLYLVNGSLTSGMITETGSRFITNTLQAGQAMVLPKGSIHFQQNNDCGVYRSLSMCAFDSKLFRRTAHVCLYVIAAAIFV